MSTRRSIFITMGALFTGILLGWQVASFRDTRQLAYTFKLLREGELVNMIELCEHGYFAHDAELSAWELEQVRMVINEDLTFKNIDDDYLRYELFIVNARLARVYGWLGRQQKVDESIAMAMTWPRCQRIGITNVETLFAFLDRSEQRRKRNVITTTGNQ